MEEEEQHDYETIGHLLPQEYQHQRGEVAIVEHHRDNDADFPTVTLESSFISMSEHSGQIYDDMRGQVASSNIDTEKFVKTLGFVGKIDSVNLHSSTISDHSGTSHLTTSDYSGSSSSTINIDKLGQVKEVILAGNDLISYQVYGTI